MERVSEQHYLENKKPTFLECIPKQIYAAIFESSRKKFQSRQMYSCRILEISLAWFP